ncbi:Gfo/Idh/MocA family protein [Paenilisteria newyorkensis]|nr:Gfo/Idh/MocA family oxidoreductase [Listeria newyorkensis]KGL40979.1 oxidoreductase [Listeria newyorkensis]KMT61926.1 oxidoreductase, Gfo/Idh/MocA family protein [Listeria newyorkensis]WAO21411.1 Gfo/Idh/MocA family oxidoreductase [Listeria newyorkensis]SQC53147.1 Virulence factor mviM homolog [Listeria newyorkensis]
MQKIAVLGLGGIAQKAYLPVFAHLDNVEVHLFTRDSQKLKAISEKYRFHNTHHSVDSMIRAQVDAAFVHTSTASHPEIVRAFLEAGIPVYVDKPVADDYETTKELIELAEAKNTLLMVGFNRRFAPRYAALAEKTDTNMILMQKHRKAQASEPRVFIFDDFIHVVDTVLHLLDAPVEKMTVFPTMSGDLLSAITVQFLANGRTATAMMNRESGTSEERLTVFTPDAKWEVEHVTELHVYEGTGHSVVRFGDWETTLYKRGFESIITDFLTAVREGKAEPVSKKSALETHRICEEILQHVPR